MDKVIDFNVIDEYGPQSYAVTLDVSAADLDREELKGTGSAKLEVTVGQGDLPGEYVAEGSVAFTADLECSRCIEPYPFANTSPFHVRFAPRPEPKAENEEIEIAGEEELDVEFFTERQIPLRDFALEQIQLSIPMKPLCDESCLGLCPTCGVNRTREKCTCESSIVDERWGTLAGLRDELSRKRDV